MEGPAVREYAQLLTLICLLLLRLSELRSAHEMAVPPLMRSRAPYAGMLLAAAGARQVEGMVERWR